MHIISLIARIFLLELIKAIVVSRLCQSVPATMSTIGLKQNLVGIDALVSAVKLEFHGTSFPRRMSRGCYEEHGPVEFKLYALYKRPRITHITSEPAKTRVIRVATYLLTYVGLFGVASSAMMVRESLECVCCRSDGDGALRHLHTVRHRAASHSTYLLLHLLEALLHQGSTCHSILAAEV